MPTSTIGAPWNTAPPRRRALKMQAVTIRATLLLVALLNSSQQYAQAKAGRDSDCLIKATKKRVFYCDSIVIGYVALATKKPTATLVVSFESKFFAGLERVKTSHGSEFRKAGHPASNYPVEFTLAIEPLVLDKLGKSSPSPLPSPAVRLPPEMRPRHVIVRWLDSSERVLAEKASDLEEVEEAWPELRPPVVWYRAIIVGITQSLASSVEVMVTGNNDALLGTIRGKL